MTASRYCVQEGLRLPEVFRNAGKFCAHESSAEYTCSSGCTVSSECVRRLPECPGTPSVVPQFARLWLLRQHQRRIVRILNLVANQCIVYRATIYCAARSYFYFIFNNNFTNMRKFNVFIIYRNKTKAFLSNFTIILYHYIISNYCIFYYWARSNNTIFSNFYIVLNYAIWSNNWIFTYFTVFTN